MVVSVMNVGGSKVIARKYTLCKIRDSGYPQVSFTIIYLL